MIDRWLKGVAIGALMCVGAGAAQAADLPTTKGPPPTPVFVPPPFTWTGFYIGLNAGGIFSTGSRSLTLVDPNAGVDGAFLNGALPGGLGNSNGGFIGGGQAGYNWQTGAFVFGVETDFDGTTLSKSNNLTGAGFFDPYIGATDNLTLHSKVSLDWLGTTRGRVGFVVTPDNRFMIYGTGGVAYGGGSANVSFYDNATGAFWSGSPSSSRVGWTIGAGAEYAFTNNWTIRGEYLYVDLGSSNFTSIGNPGAAFAFPGVYAQGHINYDASIFRAAVNYKF
jgi:outer membrane immunogenic protein